MREEPTPREMALVLALPYLLLGYMVLATVASLAELLILLIRKLMKK